MKRRSLYPFCIFLVLLLAACSVDLPSYVISQGKMERILYDYHLAQSMAEAQGGDVEQNRYLYVQKVFEKHHITEAQFDTSMVWYSGHASHLEEIYKRLEAGLNIPEEDKYARYTSEGDTANIWQGHEMVFLHGNREHNLYTLVLPADSAFRRGDYFMFRASNRFVAQERQHEGYVLIQVRYDNDSLVSRTSMIGGDYDVTINITKDQIVADHDIKSISITFYYYFDERTEDEFNMWVISKPVFLRYHAIQEETGSADSLTIDSLNHDTLTIVPKDSARERVSPEKLRSSQPVERKINVVQKKKVVMPIRPTRAR